ncbi:MAG TPA: DOMON-like domain-containing protein [Allosphingosinicella sp.]|jgi:hypothetical protein
MQTRLWSHPACGNFGLGDIDVQFDRPTRSLVRVRYTVVGDISDIVVPPPAEPLRTDGLWESTCFELFLRRPGENEYLELNFAPSGEWAAYNFRAFRKGMVQAAMPGPPEIRASVTADRLEVEVAVSPWLDDGPYTMNIAAILQNHTGDRTFWSVSHPAGEPDFHHPSCFIKQLPAAPRP